MARDSVADVTALQDEVFDDVVADDLGHVHDRVPRDVRHGSWTKKNISLAGRTRAV